MNWYTADTHFFHSMLREKHRTQYGTVAAMNTDLICKWNDVVKPEDTITVLGDFSFGKAQETRDIVQTLNGYKCLILGNHDQRSRTAYLKMGFSEVNESGTVQKRIRGEWFLLSHFPYREGQIARHIEKFGERYTPGSKQPLLCGHVHGAWTTFGKNMLNVGVDVWNGYPISEDQVATAFGLIL